MKRIAALLMLAALSWAAQENKNPPPKPANAIVEKLFVLKYADPGPVMNLVRALGGQGNENTQLRAIAVTAEKSAMAVIEDAIKQLDVPSAAPKSIELTVDLIMGTDAESNMGNPVPKELENVVAQLRGSFPFKNYRQVDLIELRSRTGESTVAADSESGAMAGPGTGTVMTHFLIRHVGLAQDGTTVRLDGMEASIRWPDLGHPLNLNASVDVKEGQRVVVGRIGVSHDQALFLVLTAHAVQ